MGAGAADTEDGSPFATDLSADTFIHTFICSEYKDHKMQQWQLTTEVTEPKYKKKNNKGGKT